MWWEKGKQTKEGNDKKQNMKFLHLLKTYYQTLTFSVLESRPNKNILQASKVGHTRESFFSHNKPIHYRKTKDWGKIMQETQEGTQDASL